MFSSAFKTINIKSQHHLNRYLSFISSRDSLRFTATDLIESHHILPCSLFKKYSNDPKNLIKLTTREHFLAHNMLAKAVGGKMWLAFTYMCDSRPLHYGRIDVKINSKTYAIAKKEASRELSKRTKINRKNESVEQKTLRVEKWKSNFSKKSQQEKDIIFAKCRETRIANDKPYVKPNAVECKTCGQSFIKLVMHKCKVKIKENNDIENAAKRAKRIDTKRQKERERSLAKIFKKLISLLKKVRKIKEQEERKLIRTNNAQSRICSICNKSFSAKLHFDNHIKTKNCHLTPEEKQKLSRVRARENINSKSVNEKRIIGEKISEKRKKYLASLSINEKLLYHEKLKASAISYYESDRYNANQKSIQVKNGLNNAKNSRN